MTLTQGENGNLYGTTSFGGRCLQRASKGTIFETDAK
jgi:uncharacterized repeat protein (TIGR03803 family)